MSISHQALADVFFTAELGDTALSLDDAIREKCPGWLADVSGRSGIARGMLFFWLGRTHPAIVAVCDARGSWTMLFLQAWLGHPRRKVILLEFIRRKPLGRRRFIYPAWFRIIARPAVRRTMITGQVLTEWEKQKNAELFGIPPGRLEYIPWPLSAEGDVLAPFDSKPENDMVLSSGRAVSDWETLFQAAEGQSWPLTVVCGRADLAAINILNQNGRARVLNDISFEDHHAMLKDAAVYVISLKETEGSTGQVRLSNSVRAGAPVVATRVRGLEGYVIDGESGILVEPGDWRGLRAAIEGLLADRELRRQLRQTAFLQAGRWTYEQYFATMRKLVDDILKEAGRDGGPE